MAKSTLSGLVSILVGLLAGCGGGGTTTSAFDVAIAAPADRSTVSGVFVLEGTARGGAVEVAVDDGPFLPAAGDHEWSLEVDSKDWAYGYHTVQARVGTGSRQATDHVSLFCANGAPPPAPDPPPLPPLPPVPPDDGVVAHWTFDNLAGDTLPDLSGYGNDGTIRGGAELVTGKLNVGLSFDGSDDEVYFPDLGSPPPALIGGLSRGTISVWFRYDSVLNDGGLAEVLPILYFGRKPGPIDPSDLYDSLQIYVGHGDLDNPLGRRIYFTILKGNELLFCFDSAADALEQGRWYHYAVSMDTNGHAAYLDGKKLDLHYTQGGPGEGGWFFDTIDDREILVLGYGMFGVSTNWWHFHGAIDDLRIYDRPLGASAIAALAGG